MTRTWLHETHDRYSLKRRSLWLSWLSLAASMGRLALSLLGMSSEADIAARQPLGLRGELRAFAVGLAAMLGASLVLVPLRRLGYVSPSIAMGVGFGVFLGVSQVVRERYRNPAATLPRQLWLFLLGLVLGSVVFGGLMSIID
jgi:hypothetical protein